MARQGTHPFDPATWFDYYDVDLFAAAGGGAGFFNRGLRVSPEADSDPIPAGYDPVAVTVSADATAGAPTLHKTTTEAGAYITRDNYHWGTTLGVAPSSPITFGFRTSAAPYSVTGHDISQFSAFSASEQTAARAALQFWSDVSGIRFTDLGNTNSATILFANYRDQNDNSQAFAFFPGSTSTSSASGDVFMNLAFASTTITPGGYDWLALIHEIGHTLGLEHPGSYNATPGQSITYGSNAEYIEDTRQYTVMSYFSASYTGATHYVYNETPALDDIAAIQRLYGANTTTRTGDSTYGFNSNVGGVYGITSASQQVVFAVWDAGGSDTFDFSGYSQPQTVDLRADHFSSVGGATYNIAIALGVTIENGIGGSGNDTLIGNDANNVLRGGSGNDTIDGGNGSDRAVFSGLRSAYTLTALSGNGVHVVGPDGTDDVTNVEFLVFNDQTVPLPLLVNHAPVISLPSGANLAATSHTQTIPLSSLFTASDADNDPLAYMILDNTVGGGSGHFNIGGVAQKEGGWIGGGIL